MLIQSFQSQDKKSDLPYVVLSEISSDISLIILNHPKLSKLLLEIVNTIDFLLVIIILYHDFVCSISLFLACFWYQNVCLYN